MTAVTLEAQHMAALHRAQEVRLAIAAEKVRLHGLAPAERRREIQMVLRAEELPALYAAMRVAHVLGSLKGVGSWKVEWMLGRVRVSSGDRKLRELTVRQRVTLADLIEGRS